jgi:hypothetical protein
LFKREVPARVYTREGVCRKAASFKRDSRTTQSKSIRIFGLFIVIERRELIRNARSVQEPEIVRRRLSALASEIDGSHDLTRLQ